MNDDLPMNPAPSPAAATPAGPDDAFHVHVLPDGEIEPLPDVLLRFVRTVPATSILDPSGSRPASSATSLTVVERVWRGPGNTVPVFWTALFDRSEIDPTRHEIRVAAPVAAARLAQRSAPWKARSTHRVHRGYEQFRKSVAGASVDEIVLELPIAPWRRTPFASAIRQVIDFVDGKVDHPGRLLAGFRDCLMWKRRSGGYRLETVERDARWPDEIPLFAAGSWHLGPPTTGEGPFGHGPWPERRFSEDPDEPLPLEAAARAQDTRRTLKSFAVATAATKGAERWSNPDLVNQACSAWGTFIARASALADSAPAFARTYRVLDDGPLWREMIGEGRRTMLRIRRFGRELELMMERSDHVA
jgi:hypothetical protein